jgi:hypothetical protein
MARLKRESSQKNFLKQFQKTKFFHKTWFLKLENFLSCVPLSHYPLPITHYPLPILLKLEA